MARACPVCQRHADAAVGHHGRLCRVKGPQGPGKGPAPWFFLYGSGVQGTKGPVVESCRHIAVLQRSSLFILFISQHRKPVPWSLEARSCKDFSAFGPLAGPCGPLTTRCHARLVVPSLHPARHCPWWSRLPLKSKKAAKRQPFAVVVVRALVVEVVQCPATCQSRLRTCSGCAPGNRMRHFWMPRSFCLVRSTRLPTSLRK